MNVGKPSSLTSIAFNTGVTLTITRVRDVLRSDDAYQIIETANDTTTALAGLIALVEQETKQ